MSHFSMICQHWRVDTANEKRKPPVLIADGVVRTRKRLLHDANNEIVALYTKTLKALETAVAMGHKVTH
jgi:hypothetical protein